jgi:hypothetical protein
MDVAYIIETKDVNTNIQSSSEYQPKQCRYSITDLFVCVYVELRSISISCILVSCYTTSSQVNPLYHNASMMNYFFLIIFIVEDASKKQKLLAQLSNYSEKSYICSIRLE